MFIFVSILHFLYHLFLNDSSSAALPPEITRPPQQDLATVDGKTIDMTCRTFGAPKPIVKWFHDNDELTGGRFEIKDNGDLRIK